MFEILKQKSIPIVESLHRRIFGHEMSEEMRKFLGNLSISFFGGAFYSVLLFIVSILAGRFLGPIDYGKYALYVSLFSFFTIFLSFGLETTIIRLAAKADADMRKKIISTFIFFFFVNAIFWSLISFIFKSLIVKIFGLPVLFIFFALLFSMTNSIGMIIENYLKLLNKFLFINIIRVCQGLFLLVFLILLRFLFGEIFSLSWFIFLSVAASLLVLVVYFLKAKSYLKFILDIKTLKELLLFSSFLFLSVISGYLIQSGTVILINKFIGLRDLGLYNAYYSLSLAITGQVIGFFVAAYFPALAQSTNKVAAIKKIDKMIPIITLPWLIISSLIMFFGIKLYGTSYPLDIGIIVPFSFYSLFYLYGVLYGYIVISNASNILVRNMYAIWFLIVVGYFFVLFLLSYYLNMTVQIVLWAQVIAFGINAFLNRAYCDKIINN